MYIGLRLGNSVMILAIYVASIPSIKYHNFQSLILLSETNNTSSTPKPSIIVTPSDESQVQAAIICSRNIGIQLRIRSGGHDYDGLSYISDVPFFILDMFNLQSISVNINDKTAWFQAGATLGEL